MKLERASESPGGACWGCGSSITPLELSCRFLGQGPGTCIFNTISRWLWSMWYLARPWVWVSSRGNPCGLPVPAGFHWLIRSPNTSFLSPALTPLLHTVVLSLVPCKSPAAALTVISWVKLGLPLRLSIHPVFLLNNWMFRRGLGYSSLLPFPLYLEQGQQTFRVNGQRVHIWGSVGQMISAAQLLSC